jgi:DNA-binding NarL/FixJ family response regulator
MLSILLANDGGFLVVAAAVAMAAAADPDLVLLDLEMPVMDGLTALPQLRKVAPRARIVVLSAYPDPFTLVDALRAGADLCLDKAAPLIDIVSELAVLFELPVSGSRALSEMAGES